ncbi:hypothetical protein CRYUN_Cryun28dG0098700 [Craigia yunnanensis]
MPSRISSLCIFKRFHPLCPLSSRLSLKSLLGSQLTKCSTLLMFTWVKSCHHRRKVSKLTSPKKRKDCK